MMAVAGRGRVPGLQSPHPLAAALPAVYADDDFAQRFTAALDEVLAPALSSLDNLWAYLDAALAPADFLEWLAGWVGVSLDQNWSLERQRELVARAAGLFARRGTAQALTDELALYTGVAPEVAESGGVTWSRKPGDVPPGRPEPRLTIRVRVPDPAAVDQIRLGKIVAEAKPANVVHTVEVVRA